MLHRSSLPLLKDRYQLVSPLGSGGMGTVYLAEDHRLGNKLVAVKENRHSSPEQQEQFNREALLLSNFEDYPNLPRVTDYFTESDGRQYLVMDYIEGDNLLQILQSKNQPLPEAQVLSWLDPILTALMFLHQRPKPVIHRDIKPSNIKRRTDGKIFLVDFGLAKVSEDDLTVAGARGAVTVGYASPEQYHGGTDARSDIYSLGATLYHLLTSRKPPDARDLVDKTTRLTAPRTVNPNISRKMDRVILKAMALAPKDRYQTVGELRAALPTLRQQPTPNAKRQRKGNALDFLLAALVVMLGALILFLLLGSPIPLLLGITVASPTPTATATPTATPTITPTPTQSATSTAPVVVATVAPRCPVGMIFVQEDKSAFCIDQTEVSNAAYGACVADAICDLPPLSAVAISPTLTYTLYANDPAYADYPVLNVTVTQAIQYCEQYVGVLQKQPNARLPTFAEWWIAYRQSKARSAGAIGPLPVTAAQLQGAGAPIFGMAGNVQEWVVAQATPWVAVALGENFADTDFPDEDDTLSDFRRVLTAEANSNPSIEVGFRCAAALNAAMPTSARK